MADAAPALRLFFALWPDEAAREALLGLQRGLVHPPGARAVAPANLHLTMAFLGMQPGGLLPEIEAVLDRVPVPDMTLELDCYGCFARARIAWAGLRRPPAALGALHRALMDALGECGIGRGDAAPFRPHVTLLRNAVCEGGALDAPFRWETPRLALVRSTTTQRGPVYEVLAQRGP